MASKDVAELVSQAEKEGVTLAEMISRMLTPKQIDEMERGLRTELASNYCRIESFMSDVKVASLDELMGLEESEAAGHAMGRSSLDAGLSDDTA